MSRAWKRWLRAGGIVLMACTDSNAPPAPVQLAFTMQPNNAAAGAAIGPVVAVAIQDASGDLVPSTTDVVTVVIARNAGGGTLTGTASVAAVNGVATFPDLHIDKMAAGYTLKAAATGLTAATSIQFTITAAPATQLVFTVQPGSTMGGAAISPPVQVTARDSFGNFATPLGDSVTVTLGGGPEPGALSGTTVVDVFGGVATFRDLSIAQEGAGYTLTASAGGITGVSSAPFDISKPMGSLRITTATSGLPDPDGYEACIDPIPDGHGGTSCRYGASSAIGANDAVTMTVDTGAHTVLLIGVAANCTVAGDNPRAVHAARGQPAAVPFAVDCVAVTLHVTTTTTGVSIDRDGYRLCVDPYPDPWDFGYVCTTNEGVGVNGGVTVSVAPGTHAVQLDDVAANCTVEDNPRGVDAGTATHVSFVIGCVAAGAVRVTVITTGIDLPFGYQLCVDRSGSGCLRAASMGVNGTVTIPDLIVGPHTVTLTDMAGNCTMSGATIRAVTVPQDVTVDVAFDIRCVEAERIAFSRDGTIMVARVDAWDPHGITAGFAPAWSPSGARLAYECGQDICTINADGTGFARLTLDAAGNHHPTWSPDGAKIAFAATRAGVADLFVMTANGSGATRLAQGVGFVGSPAWSPDGAKIAFDCWVDAGNDDICSVNADGTGFARLTNDPARDYGAAWKPDGSTLAFATTRYGGEEIALAGANGGSVRRIGAGLPGLQPAWSPDGSQLALMQLLQSCGGWYDECEWYNTYAGIVTANADGSGVRYRTPGDQPAWKPHP